MQQILVTGGTGTLGRLVVPRLRDAGYKVRVLSRNHHEAKDGIEFVTGDLATGAGVEAAAAGAEIIVHLAGSGKGDEDKTRNLIGPVIRSGTARHLVYISVVGADRASFDYFAAKLASERLIAESGVPWTTLRATQFHDLILTVAKAMAKLPVIPVPAGFQFQPVDADEVATRLVELALGTPARLVPDLAGPKVQSAVELLHEYLRASHQHRLIVPVPLPGKAARAFRDGVNLAPERAVGKRTWEEFLSDHLAAKNQGRQL